MRYRRKVRLAFVVCLVMIMVLSTVIIVDAASGKNAANAKYKYYTSVEIQKGDTLLSIADKYISADYKNKQAYIEEVLEINGLSDDTIHAGQYLTVPYYSFAKRE